MKNKIRNFFLAVGLSFSFAVNASPELSLGSLKIGDSQEGVEAALAEMNKNYNIFPIESYSGDKVLGYMGEHIERVNGKNKLLDAAFVRVEGGKVVAISRNWSVPTEQAILPSNIHETFLEKFGKIVSLDSSFLKSRTPSVDLYWLYTREGKVLKGNVPECGASRKEATFSGSMAKFKLPATLFPGCQFVIEAKAHNRNYTDEASQGLMTDFQVMISDIATQYELALAAEERTKAEEAAKREAIADKAKGNKLAL